MSKQIFVHFLSAADSGHLDDVPLFNQLPYEEWMTEADVADFIRKKFADLFKFHKLDIANTAYFENRECKVVSSEEIAEVTIAYALEYDCQFWWIFDQSEDIFDVYERHKEMSCLISVMDTAVHRQGWK